MDQNDKQFDEQLGAVDDVEMGDWVDEDDGAGAFTTAVRDLLDSRCVCRLDISCYC